MHTKEEPRKWLHHEGSADVQSKPAGGLLGGPVPPRPHPPEAQSMAIKDKTLFEQPLGQPPDQQGLAGEHKRTIDKYQQEMIQMKD